MLPAERIDASTWRLAEFIAAKHYHKLPEHFRFVLNSYRRRGKEIGQLSPHRWVAA